MRPTLAPEAGRWWHASEERVAITGAQQAIRARPDPDDGEPRSVVLLTLSPTPLWPASPAPVEPTPAPEPPPTEAEAASPPPPTEAEAASPPPPKETDA